MAGTLTTALLARLVATREVALGAGTQRAALTVEEGLDWPDGSGASQADEVWVDNDGSVANGAFDNLDLFGLSQLDGDADTERAVSFANIKGLIIRNTSAADHLLVGGGTGGGGAADAWVDAVGTEGWLAADGDLIRIPAGGGILLWFPSGVTVSNGTSHILCLAGITSTQTYEIEMIGDTV